MNDDKRYVYDDHIQTNVNQWRKEDFKEILVVGNGDGLLDAPLGIFWDDNFFKIGINRAYMLGMMNCCVFIDIIDNFESIHNWGGNTLLIHAKSKLKNTQLPIHKPNQLDVFKELMYNNENNLYRRKNTLFPALDLACRLSQKQKAINLIGVSFDTKGHFYTDESELLSQTKANKINYSDLISTLSK